MSQIYFIAVLFALVITVILLKKLTVTGAICGGVIASLLFAGTGGTGVWLLGSFFVLGTVVTASQKKRKLAMGYQHQNDQRRDIWQVLANGGVAGVLGLVAWLRPDEGQFIKVMVACSLSSAAADTVSSELGTIYGKKFVNILSLRPDIPGNDGAISVFGLTAGIFASATIALVYAISEQDISYRLFLLIIISGTAGNLIDSFVGASLQRKGVLGNNMVNLINTVSAPLFAWVLYNIFI